MPIHVWDGERIEGCQAAGRTRPLFVAAVIRGPEGEVSERREFLVKAMGLPEISRTGLFAEYGTGVAHIHAVRAHLDLFEDQLRGGLE